MFGGENLSEASIRISARDNYSSAINTMRNSTRHFTNDANGLQEKLNELSRTKATIKLDMREAAKNLRNLEREYEQLKNSSNTSAEALEAAAERVRTASSEYAGMRRNLNLVNNEIRSTERSFASFERTRSRSTDMSAIKGFAIQMATEQVSQLAQQATQYFIGSSF